MNLDELRDELKPAPVAGQVAFLPWLWLKAPVKIAGVQFVPYRDESGQVNAAFREAETSLTMIFSSYVDRDNDPIESPVIATIPARGWNVPDEDFETVSWAARLLFLACFAANEYFVDGGGHYVNSIPFRPVWQKFTGGPFIALTSRRRYGRSTNGGYQHGQINFNVPLQCTLDWKKVDELFLEALDAANASGRSTTIEALKTALPYVELANTDDELMNEPPEAILMASAFEQLLKGEASAYTLGKNFGDLFKKYGTVTVAAALKTKPKIKIDNSTPERAAGQPKWWTHQKWMEELYGLRNESAHEGTIDAKDRAWSAWEHLVIAAFVFPLAVKLLLERNGFYTPTPEDRTHCKALDQLLTADHWNRKDHERAGQWAEIIRNMQSEEAFEAIVAAVQAAYPDEPAAEAAGGVEST